MENVKKINFCSIDEDYYMVFYNHKIILTDVVSISIVDDTVENREKIEKELRGKIKLHPAFLYNGGYEEYTFYTGMDEETDLFFVEEENNVIISYDVDCRAFSGKYGNIPKTDIIELSDNGDITILSDKLEKKSLDDFLE